MTSTIVGLFGIGDLAFDSYCSHGSPYDLAIMHDKCVGAGYFAHAIGV